MNIKLCSDCNLTKSLDEFYKQVGRPYNTMVYCKTCFNKRCIRRWILRKKKALEYKNNCCKDCNICYPEYPYSVFEFHHIIPSEKQFNWTKLRLQPWDIISKELDKCDLLCANCHRIRHHEVSPEQVEFT
jgi:hypothetical protein